MTTDTITDSPSTVGAAETTTLEYPTEISSTPDQATTTEYPIDISSTQGEATTTPGSNGAGWSGWSTSSGPEGQTTSVATTESDETTSAESQDTTSAGVGQTSTHMTTVKQVQTTPYDTTTDVEKTTTKMTTENQAETTTGNQEQTTIEEIQSTGTSLILEETTDTGILSTIDKQTNQSTTDASTENYDIPCTCVEGLASELQSLLTTIQNTTEMQQCLKPVSKKMTTDQQTMTPEDAVTTDMHKTTTDSGTNVTGSPMCTCVEDLTTEALKNLTSSESDTTTERPTISNEDGTSEMPRTTGGNEVNATGCPEYTCPTVTVQPCTIPNQFISMQNGATTEMPRTTVHNEMNATGCPVCTCPTVMPFSFPTEVTGVDGKVSAACPTVLPCTTDSDIPLTTDEENIMTTESLKIKKKLTRRAFLKMMEEWQSLCTCPETTTLVMTTELVTNHTEIDNSSVTTAGKKEYYTIKKRKRPVIVHEKLDLTDVKRAEESDYGPLIGSCFMIIVLAEVAFMVFLDLISIKMHIDMIKQNLGLV